MTDFKWKTYSQKIEISGCTPQLRYEAWKLSRFMANVRERSLKAMYTAITGETVYHHGDKV